MGPLGIVRQLLMYNTQFCKYLAFKGIVKDEREAKLNFFGDGKVADIKFSGKKLIVKDGIILC
jgi:pyruvate dehydrogenase complex dehydrogenase (E1) component